MSVMCCLFQISANDSVCQRAFLSTLLMSYGEVICQVRPISFLRILNGGKCLLISISASHTSGN